MLLNGIDEEHSTLSVCSFIYSLTKKQGLFVIDVMRQKCSFSYSMGSSHQGVSSLKKALRGVRLSTIRTTWTVCLENDPCM
jgi:hypothetical protein